MESHFTSLSFSFFNYRMGYFVVNRIASQICPHSNLQNLWIFSIWEKGLCKYNYGPKSDPFELIKRKIFPGGPESILGSPHGGTEVLLGGRDALLMTLRKQAAWVLYLQENEFLNNLNNLEVDSSPVKPPDENALCLTPLWLACETLSWILS